MTPLHPALVHLPLGLAVVLPIVAAGLAIAVWRGALPRRSWLVAVALNAVLLAGALAAQRTGEGDEDRVEKVVPKAALERHEERAEAFVWAAGGALALSAAVLLVPAGIAPAAAALAVAALTATGGVGLATGKAGGELVYVHGAARAHGAAREDADVAAAVRRERDGDDRDERAGRRRHGRD